MYKDNTKEKYDNMRDNNPEQQIESVVLVNGINI
jgi:hypothetical protein